jgi:hypothetical protein
MKAQLLAKHLDIEHGTGSRTDLAYEARIG